VLVSFLILPFLLSGGNKKNVNGKTIKVSGKESSNFFVDFKKVNDTLVS